MKTWRVAGVLAVVFLALGGLATWDEWQTKRDQIAEGQKNRLVEIKPEEVAEVEYASSGRPEVPAAPDGEATATQPVAAKAVKRDGKWHLVTPVEALADARQIDALIHTITDYTYTKEVADGKDQWAEFGLANPLRHVTLRTAGASPRSFTVYLGNKVPVGYNVYFRTSDSDKIYMGSQHLLTSTNKAAFDFRDKTLTLLDGSKVRKLTYRQRGQAAIEVTRSEGKWQIVKPEVLPADGDEIQDFISVIARTKVAAFDDKPSAELQQAFVDPEYEVTWQDDSGAATTLKVIDREGRLSASFAPSQLVFGMPDEMRIKLRRDLLHFRNRRIFDGQILGIKKVDIDGQAYANVQGNWYKADVAAKFDASGTFPGGAQNAPAEEAHVRAFLVDVEFAKTTSFVSPDDPVAKSLNAAPQHRIVLSYDDPAKAPLTLELFHADPDASGKQHYLVRTTGAPFIYRVPKTTFNSMWPSASKSVAPDEAPASDENFLDDEEGLDLNGPTGSSSGRQEPPPDQKPG